MNTFNSLNRFAHQRAPSAKTTTIHITAGIGTKGWRKIFLGASFGFTFGAMLAAIPLTTDLLTFGALGTLVIAAVECAVIASGFAALTAALSSEGDGPNPSYLTLPQEKQS